ncbi:unnamed protein product [[Candida] boidinii]|nr:unnamed protein product [[Candida] boidinii]
MPNHFENEASIEIEIGIDSRFKGEAETKIYNFNFNVLLNSNSRLPPKLNQYSGEKQYNNNSKNNSQDQYINNNSYNNTNDVVPQSQPLSNPPNPPLYDDIFDSSEIGNESSNRSTAHVAKQ